MLNNIPYIFRILIFALAAISVSSLAYLILRLITKDKSVKYLFLISSAGILLSLLFYQIRLLEMNYDKLLLSFSCLILTYLSLSVIFLTLKKNCKKSLCYTLTALSFVIPIAIILGYRLYTTIFMNQYFNFTVDTLIFMAVFTVITALVVSAFFAIKNHTKHKYPKNIFLGAVIVLFVAITILRFSQFSLSFNSPEAAYKYEHGAPGPFTTISSSDSVICMSHGFGSNVFIKDGNRYKLNPSDTYEFNWWTFDDFTAEIATYSAIDDYFIYLYIDMSKGDNPVPPSISDSLNSEFIIDERKEDNKYVAVAYLKGYKNDLDFYYAVTINGKKYEISETAPEEGEIIDNYYITPFGRLFYSS